MRGGGRKEVAVKLADNIGGQLGGRIEHPRVAPILIGGSYGDPGPGKRCLAARPHRQGGRGFLDCLRLEAVLNPYCSHDPVCCADFRPRTLLPPVELDWGLV